LITNTNTGKVYFSAGAIGKAIVPDCWKSSGCRKQGGILQE
jgi:hypothetical protein